MTTNTCCNYEKTTEDLNRRLSVKQLLTIQSELNEFIVSGWSQVLTPCHFQVALSDELCEFLGSGIDWKHWKHTDPDAFDEFNAKVEIADASFFFLSLMIMWNHKTTDQFDFCKNSDPYDQFDLMYVGTDKGRSFSGIGLLSGNKLNHCNFVSLQAELLSDQCDIFKHIDTLDKLVSSIGLSSVEYSAFYAAKESLNRFRQTDGYLDGTYVKVQDGLEDNERLKPLIDEFLEDSSMTLDQLKQNVEDAFFEEATP